MGRPGRLCGRAAYSAPRGGEAGPGEKGLPVAPEVCCGGGVQNETLVFYRAAEKGSGRRGRSPVGAGGEQRPWGSGAGAPRGGSPAAAARASRPSLGVSGSSMATRRRRRRATPLTPHFQIKMAQAQALGGRRDPLPLRPCPKAAVPTGHPGDRGRSGDLFPAWKGLGRRKGSWGCSRWGVGGSSLG